MPTMIDLVCTNCEKGFQREKRQVSSSKCKKVKNYFCSKSCNVAHGNRNKVSVGDKTSLTERWIVQRIRDIYPDLDIECSRKDLLRGGGELDIFFPSLRLAFEVQGKTHYQAIYGEEVLHNTQANDQRKRDMCKEAGIELIEIDISGIEGVKDPKYLKVIDQVFAILAAKAIF